MNAEGFFLSSPFVPSTSGAVIAVGEPEALAATDPQKAAEMLLEPPEAQKGFTLGPNQVRYGPGGREIARNPLEPQKGFTLGPNQVHYGPGGIWPSGRISGSG